MRRFLPFLILLLALGARAQTPLEATGLAVIRNSSVANVQSADTVLDFHSQTLGQGYDTNFIQSDVYGNTGSWMVSSEGVFNTNVFTNVVVPSFPLSPPIRTPDGHLFSTTPTTGVRESLAEGATGSLILQYTVPGGANLSSVRFWCMASNVDAQDLNNHDQWQHLNPYGIAQFSFYNSLPGRLTVGYHSSIAGANPSAVPSVATNLWMEGELVTDVTNGFGFIVLRDATTRAFLSSSIGYGAPEANLQTLFKFEGGYQYEPVIDALFYRGISILAYGPNVPTNRPPWIPSAPSSFSGSQSGSEILLTWTDNNSGLNTNWCSISNSTDGEIVRWCQAQSNSISIPPATGGTYDIRVASYFLNGRHSDVVSGTPVVFSPAVWYESIAAASLDSSVDQNAAYINYSVNVTVATGGTCSALRVNVATLSFGTTPIKLALFDNSGNLIAATSGLTGATPGTLVYSISPVSVSAGTYKIAAAMNSGGGGSFFGSKSGTTGTQGRYSKGTAYSGFPDSTITGDGTEATHETMSMGMLVQ